VNVSGRIKTNSMPGKINLKDNKSGSVEFARQVSTCELTQHMSSRVLRLSDKTIHKEGV
jgi:hypothetical protein